METKLNVENSEAKFEFSFNKEDWEQQLNAAYERTKGKYKVPGFRPGHATRKIIELHYGPMAFFDEAMDGAMNFAYGSALDAHPELNTYGQPKVELGKTDEDTPFAFTATVALIPEPELGAYTGLKLLKHEHKVTDEAVKLAIDAELKKAARIVTATRPAQDKDTVNIDYVGSVDGVEFEGGKAEKQDLVLGSNTFIPGFEAQLVGKSAGEECDVNVKFPDDYHAENLKGKDAVFKVKVNEVKFEEVPELNDEFVADHSEVKTVDEYKANIRKGLETQAERSQKNERFDEAIKAATANAKVTVPAALVDGELDEMLEELEHNISHYAPGIKIEDYLKYNGMTVEDFRKDRRETAENQAKTRLVLRAIIAKEKLDATEDDMKAKVKAIAEQAGKSVEEYEKLIEKNKGQIYNYFANEIVMDKLSDLMLTKNEFVLDEPVEEKPAKKPAAKKAAADKADGEKKPAAKKPAAKKAEPKTEA